MFRSVAGRVFNTLRGSIQNAYKPASVRTMSSHQQESDEEFDSRYEAYLNKTDIDGWQLRKAMNDLAGMDLVPEPKIIIAALKACRRINDYSLAVRFLEVIKEKSEAADSKIYPYILQEIKGTLDELGVNTPEQLGYDKPELALQNVDDIH